MAAISLAAWERFYERVVARGGNWPRALWFAAVEDGLEGALPENSRLLAEYRRHVAEWKQLEGEVTARHGEAQRIAQLEADIMRLIGYANQTIRERAADGELARPALGPAPRNERSGAWLGVLTGAVILLCGSVLGATYYQNRLMIQEVQQELAAFREQLIEEAANERASLEARIQAIERVRQDLQAAQTELRSNVAQFHEVMSQSVRSITSLGDEELAELAHRVAAEDGQLEAALHALRGRIEALERDLDGTAQSLAALDRRLPDLGSDIEGLAGRIATSDAALEEVTDQVQRIKAEAPEIALWLEGQRQGLVQTLESQRREMDEVDFEIATLKGSLNESRGQLRTFRETVEAELAGAKQQRDDLVQALDGARIAESRAAELLNRIETQAEAARGDLQARIDAILADLAKTADAAAARSAKVARQAEAEEARIETVADQAIASLSEAREQRLAELSRWATATRRDLAQTQAGLIAGWQDMDRAVAGRHAEVLANLDRNAATLESRVQDLLEALDVILVHSGG